MIAMGLGLSLKKVWADVVFFTIRFVEEKLVSQCVTSSKD